ncbi:MAG: hypothetical protein J5640_09160 [Bacteroidales bacterium]|nr:hypothetical protein [Bacteroidales bacterium]
MRIYYVHEQIDCNNDNETTLINKKVCNVDRDANKKLFPQDSYNYPLFYFKYDSLCVDIDFTPLDNYSGLDSPFSRSIPYPFTIISDDGLFFIEDKVYTNDYFSFAFNKKCEDDIAFSLTIQKEISSDYIIDKFIYHIDFTERLINSQKNSRFSPYVYKDDYIIDL